MVLALTGVHEVVGSSPCGHALRPQMERRTMVEQVQLEVVWPSRISGDEVGRMISSHGHLPWLDGGAVGGE